MSFPGQTGPAGAQAGQFKLKASPDGNFIKAGFNINADGPFYQGRWPFYHVNVKEDGAVLGLVRHRV